MGWLALIAVVVMVAALIAVVVMVAAMVSELREDRRRDRSWREWCMQQDAPGWPVRFHLFTGRDRFFHDLAHRAAAAFSTRWRR